MKTKSSFVLIYWWLLVMLMFGIALVAFAEKEERVSESEKRMLSGFPEVSVRSILSGEFSDGFESYLSDGVFGRDSIVGVSESVLKIFCANSDEDIALLDAIRMDAELQGSEKQTQEQSQDDPTEELPSVQATDEVSGTDAQTDVTEQVTDAVHGYGLWAEYVDGRFKNLCIVTESQIRNVAAAMNSFREFIPDDGHVFYMNVPLTQTGNIVSRNDDCIGWYENLDVQFAEHTEDKVHYIDATALLEEDLLKGEHVYYRSDHHWTARGAIKAVDECMRIQGVPVVPYEEYEYETVLFTNPELNAQDDLELMYPLHDTSDYRILRGEQKQSGNLIEYGINTYAAFLGGDYDSWGKYVTGFSTGRKALVIGDSFSNAFTPYLTPYYDEVHKVDARHYDRVLIGGTMGEMIRREGIDDVYIVLSYANGVTSPTSMDKLENALYGY